MRRAMGKSVTSLLPFFLIFGLILGTSSVLAAAKMSPITIVINQSPWFEGFQAAVNAYEEETGNKVTLDVNPFGGALEKQRQSVRTENGTFDILVMNAIVLPEMFGGGFLTPLKEIDPSFELETGVNTYYETTYWNTKTKNFEAKGGQLMGVPINGNIQLLFYREDLYKEYNLKVPETWDELLENAKKLHDPPKRYGMILRGGRGSASFSSYPFLASNGGSFFKDPAAEDYTVMINSPAAKESLDFYLKLAKEAGHPNTGSIQQGDLIQLLLTGKAAHAIAVVAVWSQMDDPNKSAVIGKVNTAVIPKFKNGKHATTLGHFIGGIPKNIPRDRKVAALEFLNWYQGFKAQLLMTKAGGIPIRDDISPSLKNDEKYRWLKAYEDCSKYSILRWNMPEGLEISAAIDIKINLAITGELSTTDALNQAAEETYKLLTKYGYKTGQLPPL